MNAFTIAWKEWSRSLFNRRIPGCNGQRDFRSLSAMISLVFVFTFLILGSKTGFLDRLIDVFLGRVPGHGIPIWLSVDISQAEMLSREHIELLSKQDIPGLKFYLYRDVEPCYIAIPGHDNKEKPVWKKINQHHIKIWAVFPWDPLWEVSTNGSNIKKKDPGIPLEIVLDRALFQKHFNCKTYYEALIEKIPKSLCQNTTSLPKSENDLSCLGKNILWLDVRTGRDFQFREYLPFKIHWATKNRISSLEDIGGLFPLSTFHMLEITQESFPNYFPECEGKNCERVTDVSLYFLNMKNEHEENRLAKCLGNPRISKKETVWSIDFSNNPTRIDIIEACLNEFNIPIKENIEYSKKPYAYITGLKNGPIFSYDKNMFIHMPNNAVINQLEKNQPKKGKQTSIFDVFNVNSGFSNLIGYIDLNKISLHEAIEKITSVKRKSSNNEDIPMFSLHPTYQDALARFSFLHEIIHKFQYPFVTLFSLIIIFILLIQLGLVVIHRRFHYGILLSKGFSGIYIYTVLGSQVVLSVFFAFIVSIPFICGIRILMNYNIGVLLSNYAEYLTIYDKNINLIPISICEYLLVFIIMLFTALILTFCFICLVMKVRPMNETEPSLLLHT